MKATTVLEIQAEFYGLTDERAKLIVDTINEIQNTNHNASDRVNIEITRTLGEDDE